MKLWVMTLGSMARSWRARDRADGVSAGRPLSILTTVCTCQRWPYRRLHIDDEDGSFEFDAQLWARTSAFRFAFERVRREKNGQCVGPCVREPGPRRKSTR